MYNPKAKIEFIMAPSGAEERRSADGRKTHSLDLGAARGAQGTGAGSSLWWPKNRGFISGIVFFKWMYNGLYGFISDWCLSHPSKKYDFVSWDDLKPN